MSIMKKMLFAGAGIAALAAATPSAAQYSYAYPRAYGYAQPYSGYTQPYGYSQSYGYGQSYGYSPYAMNTSAATSQCTTAVQNRLYSRNGLAGILGSLVGAYGTTGRVVGITRVTPTSGGVRVRGLASSGRYGGYNSADLSFRCDVDYRGYVRDININRR